MPYQINFEAYSGNFAVPKEVVGADFEALDAVFLKVILLILKNSSKNYSTNLISNLLNISEAEVEKAVSYWISRGILRETKGEIIEPSALIMQKKNPVMSTQKVENGELSYLLDCMENQLKRPITSVEHKTIIHILEYIKLPADVIIMVIEYCVSIDKANARYIEKVCTAWADAGIVTHEKAEQYLTLLQESHKNENKVKKVFGISDRALIDTEKETISRWFNEYKADIEMISLAYEKTITRIGKLSFPYINKILLSWHEKGYTSIVDIDGESRPAVKGKQDTSYDIDEIDRFWDNVPKLI